ncbi:MAG: ribosome-associated translation inhibitor RaiA [Planctomycetes bacterium]|nr:ribosome-associated translation inhibitor RaiA [Planctomycetota bacterium]
MRIQVTGKHMDLTPAIQQYAEQKAGKLPRYYDGVQSISVVIERPKADHVEVEIRADVEHHDDFVAKTSGQDVYECIDLSVDKLHRQLSDFKERLKNNKH